MHGNYLSFDVCVMWYSMKEYEEKAVSLALNPVKLQALTDKLKAVRMTCPLFDTIRWVHLNNSVSNYLFVAYMHGCLIMCVLKTILGEESRKGVFQNVELALLRPAFSAFQSR